MGKALLLGFAVLLLLSTAGGKRLGAAAQSQKENTEDHWAELNQLTDRELSKIVTALQDEDAERGEAARTVDSWEEADESTQLHWGVKGVLQEGEGSNARVGHRMVDVGAPTAPTAAPTQAPTPKVISNSTHDSKIDDVLKSTDQKISDTIKKTIEDGIPLLPPQPVFNSTQEPPKCAPKGHACGKRWQMTRTDEKGWFPKNTETECPKGDPYPCCDPEEVCGYALNGPTRDKSYNPPICRPAAKTMASGKFVVFKGEEPPETKENIKKYRFGICIGDVPEVESTKASLKETPKASLKAAAPVKAKAAAPKTDASSGEETVKKQEEFVPSDRTFTWAAGVGLGLCLAGAVFSSIGLVLQKHSHNVGEGELQLQSRWRWWLGFFFLVAIGGGLDAVALMLAPLSLIAPLSGVTIVTNCLAARLCLGEQMQSIELFATIVVVIGSTLTSTFGQHESGAYDAAELESLFKQWYIAPYYFITITLLAISVAIVCFPGRNNYWQALAYANIAGILGGNQNTFLKGVMELVEESIRKQGSNQFGHLIVYLLFLAFILSSIAQLWALNEGLSKHSMISYLPMYQSALTIYGVVAGAVVFQEFQDFDLLSWVMFPIGVNVVIAGLVMFAFSTDNSKPDAEQINE